MSESSFSLKFLIFPNGTIVFFDFGRKIVGPIVFGDEIEVRNRSGVERCPKRFLTGVTDGGGRKPNDEIGVVRSLFAQMFFGQISIEILNSVDHSGIALKGDVSS